MNGLAFRVRRWRRGLSSESGAVLVVVAVSFISLLGIAAIAIDGGLLFNEKRHAQNGADHAALAAAWADCQGQNPQAAADASIVKNGYGTSELALTSSGHRYTAVVNSTVDMAFAEIIGYATAGVSAEAVAECVSGGTGSPGSTWVNVDTAVWSYGWFESYAQEPQIDGLFTNGDGCPTVPCTDPMYNWSWAGKVGHGLHIYDTGASNASSFITPATCTVASPDCYSVGGNFTTGVGYSSPVASFPYGITFDEYQPTGAKGGDSYWGAGGYNYYDLGGTGTMEFTTCAPGVYVFYGNVIYKESECGKTYFENMTIIAYGWIDITGNGVYFEPYDTTLDGIVLASFSEASPYNPVGGRVAAIDIGGGDARLRGLIYAPNGTICDCSDHTHIWGSLIGESVWITDNDPVFVFDSSFLPPVPGSDNVILMK